MLQMVAQVGVLVAFSATLPNANAAEQQTSADEDVPKPTIEIKGVQGNLLENIRAHLSIQDTQCSTPEWKVRALSVRAEAEINKALQALGHYQNKIVHQLSFAKECFRAEFTVSAGPQMHWRKVEVEVKGEANQDKRFQKMLNEKSLKPESPFRHDHYEEFKSRFESLAAERGFLDARFERSRVDVYPEEKAADLTLIFDSGKRYRLGEIRFTQQPKILDENLMRRMILLEEGNYYVQSDLFDARSALNAAQYFESVQLAPLVQERNKDKAVVPVEITVKANEQNRFTGGIGGATDTGPRVRTGYERRYINERGHSFQTNLSLSEVISELTAEYRIPWKNPVYDWYAIDAGYRTEDTDTSTSDTAKIGVSLTQRLDNEWQQTVFIDLLNEDFEVADESNSVMLLMPGVAYSRTKTDGKVVPRNGWRISAEARVASDALVSDMDMTQIRARLKYIFPLGESWRVLTRTHVGYTETDEFSRLPASLRFFAGGDTSVRGYAFEALGPKNDDGDVIGGKHLLTGSVEFEYRFLEDWAVALFADTGNAFNNIDDYELATGVGMGARWFSPIGPVRLDIAVPLESDAEDSFRIHISLGPDL